MEGLIVYIRKIAAAAGIATGAALALAPFASAAPDPTLVTDTLGSEVSSLNGLFQFDALLSGVPSGDYAATGVHGLDTLLAADVVKDAPTSGTPSILDYLLYGVDPFKAGVSGDSGAANELNGALTQFDNAYNVEAYSAANGGALDTNLSDYLYNGTIQTVLATQGETTTQAFDTLYNHGIGDLSGFFQTDLSSLDITAPAASTGAADAAAGASGLATTVSSEITSLNSLFTSDTTLAAVPPADIITAADGFKIIDPGDVAAVEGNGTTLFDELVYGFNPTSVTGDPGAYDVFNGAISKFDDALNIGIYALENGGSNLPVADFATDLFGLSGTTASTLAAETATQAITTLLGDSYSDLLGYF
jgi:hypothetical protein